jgi:hypothetical protein
MPQSLFLFVVDLLTQDDIFRAFGAKDVPAEATVVPPAYDGQKFLLTVEAVCRFAVLFPLVFGLQQLPNALRTLHQ